MENQIEISELELKQYEKSVITDHRKVTLCIESYAKINLFLDVLGKLENGYHEIVTLFSEIKLCDFVKFSLTNYHDIKLLSSNKSLINQQNLIYRVAVYIQAKYSVRYGARIYLEKNIPIAAGLGGGSSNAAATIRGLNWLWKLDLSDAEMHNIAERFGSDINFFLEGNQAIGTHRGETITPLTDEEFIDIDNILLVNPNFHITSNEAYKLVDLDNPSDKNLKQLLENKNTQFCYNKLEKGIAQKYPIIAETIEELLVNGAKKAILSGSGPTMIGVFDNPKTLEKAQKQLNKKGFWTIQTTTNRRQKQ